MSGLRARSGLLAVTLAAVTSACAANGGGGAANSCVGPLLSISAPTASPGETVTVSGEWVRSGCDDGSGEEERPYTDVAVVFLQADQSLELARTDASGDRFTATVDVTVPDTAAAGPAAFALAPDDGPCPPAVAVLIEAPGPTAELLTGSGAECGNWPAAADAQSELTPLVD